MSDTHVVLAGRLSSANALRGLAPPIQAIIDRRLHSEQIASSKALRESMESVSGTLVEVERQQQRIEYVGIFVGGVGLVLAAIQVAAAVLGSASCAR